jgi:hypothetical protein
MKIVTLPLRLIVSIVLEFHDEFALWAFLFVVALVVRFYA